MTTKTVNLYQFSELSDAAKDKAREWWRECESQEFGAHGDIYEAYETAAKLIGIEFKQRAVRLMSGKDRYEPNIFWSLDCRGSGACFEGSYSYAKGSARAVVAEFSTDTVLHGIAAELQAIQKRNRYAIACRITTDGRDVHRNAMDIDCDGASDTDRELLLEILRGFADWIYDGIKEEYAYRMSDESVDDAMQANEYTFTADGRRDD